MMDTIVYVLAGIGLLNVIGFTAFLFIVYLQTRDE